MIIRISISYTIHYDFIATKITCDMVNHGGPVSDINISKKTTISGIFDEMAESGRFESVNMARGFGHIRIDDE